MKAPATEKGFTLIESLFTILVIGIALTSLIVTWSKSAVRSADPYWQVQTATIGKLYLQQLTHLNFDEHSQPQKGCRMEAGTLSDSLLTTACSPQEAFGPDEGESRDQFDDVDDFNQLTEAPQSMTGVLESYTGYSVNILVDYAGTDFDLPLQQLKKVEIKVTTPQGNEQRFVTYRGNY